MINSMQLLHCPSSKLVIQTNGFRVAASLKVDLHTPNLNLVNTGLSSKEVMEDENKYMVGTYARTPVVLSSGKGCKLFDIEGKEYLDLTSGIAVNALGHGDHDWVEAVVQQANTLTHVSNIYYSIPQVLVGLSEK